MLYFMKILIRDLIYNIKTQKIILQKIRRYLRLSLFQLAFMR